MTVGRGRACNENNENKINPADTFLFSPKKIPFNQRTMTEWYGRIAIQEQRQVVCTIKLWYNFFYFNRLYGGAPKLV